MLSILISGCASSGYLSDRGNDLLDVLTFSIPAGFGAKARVGPFHTGLNATFGDMGFRSGALEYDTRICHGTGQEFFCIGNESFSPSEVYWGNERRCQMKRYDTGNSYFPFFTPFLDVYDSNTAKHRDRNYSFINMISHPYATQVETQASLLWGIRIGLNIGELFDFILGWSTIDIYNDDYWQINREETLNKNVSANLDTADAESK